MNRILYCLAVLLLISLIGCNTKDLDENNKNLENEKHSVDSGVTDTTRISEEQVHEPEDSVDVEDQTSHEMESSDVIFSEYGLNFQSKPSDIVDLLGEPMETKALLGVQSMHYEGLTIYLIGEEISSFELNEDTLKAPMGIAVGGSILEAIKSYSMPEELIALGMEEIGEDSELIDYIDKSERRAYLMYHDEKARVNCHFSKSSYEIDQITITRCRELDKYIEISEQDFYNSPEEIVKKFGYPNGIIFDYGISISFDYAPSNGIIRFISDDVPVPNHFYLATGWVTPNGIQLDDPINTVLPKLLNEDMLGYYGISKEDSDDKILEILTDNNVYMVSSEDRLTYQVNVHIGRNGTVSYVDVSKLESPSQYVLQKTLAFTVPVFDENAIATSEDMYLSELTLESNRKALYSRLGSPIKVISDYVDITGKNQNCYFELGKASLVGIRDFKDLSTGYLSSLSVTDPTIIGPRGIQVGDPVEKILEVFPDGDDIDFDHIEELTVIYTGEGGTPAETNSGWVVPNPLGNKGIIILNINWYLWIWFNYENGIVSEIGLSSMLD